MTSETINIIIALLVAFFGTAGIGGLVTALKTKKEWKKSKAEDEKTKAEAETERVKAVRLIIDTANEQREQVIEEAERAKKLLKMEQTETDKWKVECEMLGGKYSELSKRLDALESEKRKLLDRITELEGKIADLLEENQRLKEERRNAEAVVS